MELTDIYEDLASRCEHVLLVGPTDDDVEADVEDEGRPLGAMISDGAERPVIVLEMELRGEVPCVTIKAFDSMLQPATPNVITVANSIMITVDPASGPM